MYSTSKLRAAAMNCGERELIAIHAWAADRIDAADREIERLSREVATIAELRAAAQLADDLIGRLQVSVKTYPLTEDAHAEDSGN
jgi:hypothetical protein